MESVSEAPAARQGQAAGGLDAGSGILIGEGVVLRPVTNGGVIVEQNRPERQEWFGWPGGLLLVIGFGCGLGAAAATVRYFSRRSEKSAEDRPKEEIQEETPLPSLTGARSESGPDAEVVEGEGFLPLLEAMKAIENRIVNLEAMFRNGGEKTEAVNGLRHELENKMIQTGQKQARLERGLNNPAGPENNQVSAPPADDGPAAGPELPVVSEPPPGPQTVGPAYGSDLAAAEEKETAEPADQGTSPEKPDQTGEGRPEDSGNDTPASDKAGSRTPEDVPDTPGLNLHARARYLRNLGGRMMNDGLLSGAEANFFQSLLTMKQLMKQEPDNQAYLRDLVLAYHNLGRVLEHMGQTDESADYYRQSIELTSFLAGKAPDNFDWQRGLAASYGHLGRIQTAAGNLKKAGDNLEKDVDLMRNLLEKRPDSKPWRYALAGSLHNLSLVKEKMGHGREALRGYQAEMAIMRQLMQEEPDNHACAQSLSAVCGLTGRLMKDMGQIDEALEVTLQYVDLMRGLVKCNPGDSVLKRELTVAIGQTGRLHELTGDLDRALASFEEVLAMRRELAVGAPANAIWQRDLAVGLCKVGDTNFAAGKWNEAFDRYTEALDIVRELEKTYGPEGEWLVEKCGILLRIGNHYRRFDGVRALEYYGQALAIASPQVKSGGGSAWSELEAVIKKNMARQ